MMKKLAISFALIILVSCGSFGLNSADQFFSGKVLEFVRALESRNWSGAESLVKAGVDVNSRGVNDNTPLVYMAYSSNLDGFVWLLERGANPNLNPKRGVQLYEFCARADDPRYLDEAVKHGIDLRLQRPDYVDPLYDLILSNLPIDKFTRYLNKGVNLGIIGVVPAQPVVKALVGFKYVHAREMLMRAPDLMQNTELRAEVVRWLESDRLLAGSPRNRDRAEFVGFLQEKFGIKVNLPPDKE